MGGWVRPTLDRALERFAELTDQLGDLRVREGESEYAELGARKGAWFHSTESSVTGRGRDAEFAAIDHTMELVRIRSDIRAVEAELRYLDHVIASWRA